MIVNSGERRTAVTSKKSHVGEERIEHKAIEAAVGMAAELCSARWQPRFYQMQSWEKRRLQKKGNIKTRRVTTVGQHAAAQQEDGEHQYGKRRKREQTLKDEKSGYEPATWEGVEFVEDVHTRMKYME